MPAEVNQEQCLAVAQVIKALKLRQSFLKSEFITCSPDRETKAMMFLCSLAICHQTHTLQNKKLNLVGWEYLENGFLEIARRRPQLLQPAYLAGQSEAGLSRDLQAVFSEDGKCTLDRLEERARLLIDIGEILEEEYHGKLWNLLDSCEGYLLNDDKGLYEVLDKFEAYTDPDCKKSTCLIKFLLEAGLLKIKDAENFIPIMDYHIQRVLLRMGCVEVSGELRDMLIRHDKLETDEEVRSACIEAAKLIALSSGHPILEMNDFFWPLGRSCCKEKMLCVDHQCSKEPCTFFKAVELTDHKQCLFAKVCKASNSAEYRKLWQPIVDTHFY